jgi:hypothetical protein
MMSAASRNVKEGTVIPGMAAVQFDWTKVQ